MAEMTRAQVLGSIETERRYQRATADQNDRPDMVPVLSVGETILAMELNLAKARFAWYTGHGNHPIAMGYLRKVAALAVQAGENFGMPSREGY